MSKRNKNQVKKEIEYKGHFTWLLESAGLSGGVRVIYEMGNRLIKMGWKVDYISLDDKPKWFSVIDNGWMKFDSYNYMVEYIRKSDDKRKFASTWWQTAKVLELAKREQNYYLVQDDEANYYSSVAMKDHVRETYISPLKKFTTSHWVEANVFDTTYVGIGVDISGLAKYWGKPKDRRAMFFGRRQAIKGASYQMEVAQRLSREMSLHMEVATVDPGYQISGMVKLHQGLSDSGIAKLYGTSMYFLNCSWHEGFSIPNIEAMAAGCLVVTTNNDGCMDYAVDGENCLVVSRDDPRDMVSALKVLEVNKELCQKLREGGRKTAQEWGWNPVIERLDKFLIDNS